MNKKRIILLIIVTLVLGIAVEITSRMTLQFYHLSSTFEEGLSVDYNGEDLGVCKKDDFVHFIELSTGHSLSSTDVITLSTPLPDIGNVPAPSIYFKSTYSAFEILLDGEVYKSYYMDDKGRNSFIGKNVHIVSLPKQYHDKTLSIRIYPSISDGSALIEGLFFGDYEDLEQYFIHRFFSPLHVGAVLMILGILLLMISTTFSFFVKDMHRHIATAALFVLVGVMMHTYYNCNFLYMDSDITQTILFVCMLALFPLSLLLNRTIAHPGKDKLHLIGDFLCLGYAITRIALHLLGIYYMNNHVWLIIFPIAITLFLMIRSMIILRKTGRLNESATTQYTGYFLAATFMLSGWIMTKQPLCELLPKNGLVTEISITLFTIGGMQFLCCSMINFLWISASSYSRNEEYDTMIRAAYEDSLTGLQNRASMERTLDKIVASTTDYCIISLDINDLKKTNDLFGHAAGDTLLSNFASALKDTIKDSGTCGRMGGDEFIVLSKITEPYIISNLLKELDKKLEVLTASDADQLSYRAAYGYAFRHEKDSPHTTYLLADQRMYEHKQKIKAARRESGSDAGKPAQAEV